QLYKQRWQIEIFFKWIKQHLRIKVFYGNTFNAVSVQVWIAVIAFVLVRRVKCKFDLTQSPSEIFQMLSVCIFEKTPLNELFSKKNSETPKDEDRNQLVLFKI